jgi:RimJ/RimL family protein N-acetyltransferase
MMVSLASVIKSDIRFLHQLRNHPDIRAKMLDTKPIPWSTHVKFWQKRLRRKVRNDFIVVHEGKRVGIIRLDRRNGYQEVSIIIAPEYQKMGIGTRALQTLLMMSNAKRFGARIRCDNKVSQEVFERNGFKKVYCFYEVSR